MNRLPQPPYARTARNRLSQYMRGKVPGFGTLFVNAGRAAWDWKNEPNAFVLSPEDEDPATRDWGVCTQATQPILIVNREASQSHLEATARACLRDGCQSASKIDHPTASNFDQGFMLISCAV